MKTVTSSDSEITKPAYSKLLKDLKEDPLKFLDLAGVMIVVISAQKRIVYMNKKGCEILGCDLKSIQGKNWFENFIPQRLRKSVESVFEKIMAGDIKSVGYYENPVVTKRGEEKFISWDNYVLEDEDGKMLGTISSGSDVTQKKNAFEDIIHSEEKYRNLFEAANDAILIYDFEDNFHDANPKAMELFGYSREEMRTLRIQNLYPKHAQSKLTEMKDKLKDDRIVTLDTEFISKSGESFTGEISASLFIYGGEKVIQILIREVTMKRKLEEDLKENERRFRTLVESGFDVVFTAGMDGILTYISPVIKEITGFSQEDVIGHSYTEFFPNTEDAVIKEVMAKLGARESIKNVEMKMRKKSGEEFFVSMNAAPIIEDEKVIGMQGVFTDISERKKTELQLEAKNEELEKINKMMVGRELKMAELKKKKDS